MRHSDKFIGVLSDGLIPDITTLRNDYGFTNVISIDDPSTFSGLVNYSHYNNDSIAVWLNQVSNGDYYNYLLQFPTAKLFIIHEPWQHSWSIGEVGTVAGILQNINPSAKVLIIDYAQDTYSQNNFILSNNSNTYMMCDQYYGTLLGSAGGYWSWYASHYRCYANWIHLGINDGYSSSTFGGIADSYAELFQTANSLGQNIVWACSDAYCTTQSIQNFCYAAWQKGWLKIHLIHYSVYQTCQNPNAPPEEQIWVTQSITSYGVGYIDY